MVVLLMDDDGNAKGPAGNGVGFERETRRQNEMVLKESPGPPS